MILTVSPLHICLSLFLLFFMWSHICCQDKIILYVKRKQNCSFRSNISPKFLPGTLQTRQNLFVDFSKHSLNMFASDLFLNAAIILFGNYLTGENPVTVLKGKKQRLFLPFTLHSWDLQQGQWECLVPECLWVSLCGLIIITG